MAHLWWLISSVALATISNAKPVTEDGVKDVELRMPGVQPTVVDTYLCVPMKISEEATYITGFTPHANMSTAHHILLFGCEEPGREQDTWSCGEMESESYKDMGPVCASAPKIIYAWAMDAPELKLPEGVGFKVGGNTDIKWIVLQVHYKDVSAFVGPEHVKDHSGITLHTTTTPQPKTAGVYLLSTGGEIPAKSTTYMEAACSIDQPITLHPFAFRVHAHTHGEVVSGYRVRDGQWTELGRASPKKPQMFYNVTNPETEVKTGDFLAARCTMVNKEDRTVSIGQTQQDEMCNFYLMYWVSGDKILEENYCTTEGPPQFHWNSIKSIHVENSPIDASMIPGTKKLLQASKNFASKMENLMEGTQNEMGQEFAKLLAEMNGMNGEDEGDFMTPEDELNELNQSPYDFMNELPQEYDPELLRSLMNDREEAYPDPSWNLPQMRAEEQGDYAPYVDDAGRVYYPRYDTY